MRGILHFGDRYHASGFCCLDRYSFTDLWYQVLKYSCHLGSLCFKNECFSYKKELRLCTEFIRLEPVCSCVPLDNKVLRLS